MKLVLRRDQRAAMIGSKPVFTLAVRAQLSEAEKANIKKYRLSETELYSSHVTLDKGSGLLGAASRLAWKAVKTTVLVKDLEAGKTIEVKDVVELLSIEEQIREAAQTFKAVLEAATHFGGEEVVEI